MKMVQGLLDANFIFKVRYTKWISNIVLVKNASRKWRMHVDYTDLNRSCPKDSHPLPNIDNLVDKSTGYILFSLMITYSSYNQITMYEPNWEKKYLMTKQANCS